MTDGEALFAAILREPKEDIHRLAYADWLEENGSGEMAEYIRWSINNQFVSERAIRWVPMNRELRASKIHGDHFTHFTDDVHAMFDFLVVAPRVKDVSLGVHRGLVCGLWLQWDVWYARHEELRRTRPITDVVFWSQPYRAFQSHDEYTPENLEEGIEYTNEELNKLWPGITFSSRSP